MYKETTEAMQLVSDSCLYLCCVMRMYACVCVCIGDTLCNLWNNPWNISTRKCNNSVNQISTIQSDNTENNITVPLSILRISIHVPVLPTIIIQPFLQRIVSRQIDNFTGGREQIILNASIHCAEPLV